MNMCNSYPYDFDHPDLPKELEKYRPIMKNLEKGKTVTFSPSVPLSDIIKLDEYYQRMSHGGISMSRSHNLHTISASLRGLPREKTYERDFDNAVSNWWKYALAIVGGIIYICLFFYGLI